MLCLGLMMEVVLPCMLTTHLASWLVSRALKGRTLTATFTEAPAIAPDTLALLSWLRGPRPGGLYQFWLPRVLVGAAPSYTWGLATPAGTVGKPLSRRGSGSSSAERKGTNFPRSVRRERGRSRGRFGAAPAPRRVPGRRAADLRPGGGSSSGASGRRPPGQRELGREPGAGTSGGRAGTRTLSREEARSHRLLLLKGQCSRTVSPPFGDLRTELRTQKG